LKQQRKFNEDLSGGLWRSERELEGRLEEATLKEPSCEGREGSGGTLEAPRVLLTMLSSFGLFLYSYINNMDLLNKKSSLADQPSNSAYSLHLVKR
jgi:hypothetical protein